MSEVAIKAVESVLAVTVDNYSDALKCYVQ
jgi:hypothetical protein